ncbi:cytochrome P460 family protein [Rhizobium chutanense]|uniref:Cytochrome P460 domain-containing protein n=1 Tax=Rhizobium chutanense TaxID=2035448 RepID=A0A3S0S1V0_9HYPH|nr:cytochrome P460 family protein [Rhizobium chutanense]RUL98004.1 hypothetical protein EFR84_29795 [Rhizobium chutanense]
MIKIGNRTSAVALFALAIGCATASLVQADDVLVAFPTGYESGVHYATVNRGGIREELFTSPEAIAAAENGQPMPSGTVVTMEDYRDGALYRYVVMEKRTGRGAHPAPDIRAGEWEFQWFNADGTVRAGEDLDRCHSCHRSQARQDFLFTTDRMKEAH